MNRAVRLLMALALVWTVIRGGIYLIPGDPADFLVHESLTPISLETLRKQMHLERPAWERILSLPSATSIITHENSIKTVKTSFHRSLILTALTLVMTSSLTTLLLYISFISAKTKPVFDGVSALISSTPLFVLGPMFLLLFSLRLDWFPVVQSPFLPAITLGTWLSAFWYRILSRKIAQSGQISAVVGARARGLRESTVFFNYVYYPSLGYFMAFLGTQIGSLLNGSILMEVIFQWKGMGLLLAESVSARDYPIIEICVITMAALALLSQQLGYALQTKVNPQLQ